MSHSLSLLTRGYHYRLKKILEQVIITPAEGQAILAKSLELPLPSSMTNSLGIHQGDVILRTAIKMALADMRANPWLVDYVFASLPQDELTLKEYGEADVNRAKTWFLTTDINVVMTPTLDEAKWPCISIALLDSSESTNEATLGDVHYEPTEEVEGNWPALTGPFTPSKYNPATGQIELPAPIVGVTLFKGMFVIDHVGRAHEIISVQSDTQFRINPGTVADFRNSILKGSKKSYIADLESIVYRESYRIGVHVQAEPVYLTWLHSIVLFALLRYKQVLLEARGLERTVASSSDFARDESHESEMTYSRYISLTGYVRQYWPKTIAQRLDGMDAILQVDPADTMWKAGEDPATQTWVGENDDDVER